MFLFHIFESLVKIDATLWPDRLDLFIILDSEIDLLPYLGNVIKYELPLLTLRLLHVSLGQAWDSNSVLRELDV